MRILKKNKILFTALVLLLLFGAWNLTWYIQTKNRYQPFLASVPENQSGTHSIRKEDGYVYNVKSPGYLTYTGNLGVSNSEKGESLIIWPLISGGYKYGFRLQRDGQAYEIYVDENMQSIYKGNEEHNQLIQKYKPELDNLYARAHEMWTLE